MKTLTQLFRDANRRQNFTYFDKISEPFAIHFENASDELMYVKSMLEDYQIEDAKERLEIVIQQLKSLHSKM